MSTLNKITIGFVVQTYNEDGKCTRQEFVAMEGDDGVSWENEFGEEADSPLDAEYFPLHMEQPPMPDERK